MARANVKKSEVAEADVAASPETPSQSIIRSAATSVTKVDRQGRSITVRKLSPLNKMRLHEIMGASASAVAAYVQAAFMAASVSHIDGDPVPFPTTKLQLEALVSRLDEDGLTATTEALVELMGITLDDDGNVMREGEIIAAAKNS